jgi:hypothetical protein
MLFSLMREDNTFSERLKTGAFKIVAAYYYTIVLIKSFHQSPAKGDNLVDKIANNFHQSSVGATL